MFRENQLGTDLIDEAASDVLGINRTDHRVLDVVERLGPITAGKLAIEAGLSPAAMTSSIDRLERAGYARRIPDPADRRRVQVEITPEGRKLASAIYGPMSQTFMEQAGRYPVEFLERLKDFLERGNAISASHLKRIREMRPRRPQ